MSDVSTFRLYLLRATYLLMAIGLAMMIWPRVVAAQDFNEVHKILITDLSGKTEALTHARLVHSDAHENVMGDEFGHYFAEIGYLQVMLDGSPRRSKWIHYSGLKSAVFSRLGSSIEIKATGEAGESTFSGSFPDPEAFLTGDGDLGEVTYPIKKVRSLEVLEYCDYPEHDSTGKAIHRPLARSEAARRWQRRAKRPATESWTLTDGASTTQVSRICFMDSYSTNESGNTIYFNRSWRKSSLRCTGDSTFGTLELDRGDSRVTVKVDELTLVEFTGRSLGTGKEGRPEVTVQRRGGSPVTAGLVLAGLDADDALVWHSSLGYEGVSLLPLRRITLRR
ncbi:MAG: hypothetical protein HYV63_31740 [Candidatus Schekmanbacteria bacterium]|nr:hypothetical protein [Candidatus Schekmanbacteria bacterium]